MFKSILKLAVLAGVSAMYMSDADAAATPKALFFNETTNVIFVDASDRAPEDGIRQIQPDEVDGLRSSGAAVDQSVTDFLASTASAPSVETATPDASVSTSATDAETGNAVPATVDSSPSATVADGASSAEQASTVSADASGEGAVSPAVATSASDTASSAQAASPVDDTAEHEAALAAQPNPGVTYEPVADTSSAPTTGDLTAAAWAPTLAEVPVDDASAPVDQNTGKVVVDADSHSEAKDRFAGIMAALHQFEEDSVEKLKEELRAIGVLLHLHSEASRQADTTGDYKSSDLS